MNKKLLILLFLATALTTAAQKNIDTDRPDQTESAFTVPKHWLQLEAGLSKQQNNSKENEYLLPTLLSKYGITNRIELRLITSFQLNTFSAANSINGLVPVEVGSKISLWQEKKCLPKTSLIFHVALPHLASTKYKTENVPFNFRLTMQHTLSEKISIGYNAGAEWDGESSHAIWVYTFTTGVSITEKWYSYIEAFGSAARSQTPQHNIDGGIAYTIGNNAKVDLSSGFGISNAAPDWYIAAGFSIRFNLKK